MSALVPCPLIGDPPVMDAEEPACFRDLFPDARPVFVLGAARSGTTITAEMLRQGAGIPGCREGFLFTVAHTLVKGLDEFWRVSGPELERMGGAEHPDPEWVRALSFFDIGALKADVLRHFHRIYEGRYGSEWIDKTPDRQMLEAVPMLAAAYPRARWVYVQRNGLQSVSSRRTTHAEHAHEASCRDWAEFVSEWRRLKGHFRPGTPVLEIEHGELTRDPERVAGSLAELLGADAAAAARMAEVVRTVDAGRTSADPAAERRLADTGWPAEDQEAFRRICGPLMDELGYPW